MHFKLEFFALGFTGFMSTDFHLVFSFNLRIEEADYDVSMDEVPNSAIVVCS
jgi:hypothetical protein